MGWIFRWNTLGPPAPPEHRFSSTTYPSVVADRGHSVASSAGCFQDGARISQHLRRFLEPHDEFAALRRPPQSTEVERLVERQLHIMYICVMVSCQHGSACQRNVCSTQWVCATKDWRGFSKRVQPGTSKVYLIKWPTSIYTKMKSAWKFLIIPGVNWWRSCCELRFSASLRVKRVGRLHCSCKARCTSTQTRARALIPRRSAHVYLLCSF